MFDMLQHSAVLRGQVQDGSVVLGINEPLRDPATKRKKDLDLVVAARGDLETRDKDTLADLAIRWHLRLDLEQQHVLADLPPIANGPVGTVLAAFEAKACMTAHVKALPRLFDELTTSHQVIHAHAAEAIAVGLVIVNASEHFISSDLNKRDLAIEAPVISTQQPHGASRAIEKMHEIPLRSGQTMHGFDAMGAILIEMTNDDSPVKLLTAPPAPDSADALQYDRMLRRLVDLYEAKFSALP